MYCFASASDEIPEFSSTAHWLAQFGCQSTETSMRKMKKEKRILVDCFDNHSRSRMLMSLLLMHRHGIIDDADLNEFSTGLQEWIRNSISSLDGDVPE